MCSNCRSVLFHKNLSVTPLGLLNVLSYITLLPVVVFFYALCVFYVAFCLRLFTLVYVPFVWSVLCY